jgi:hypothetical protein
LPEKKFAQGVHKTSKTAGFFARVITCTEWKLLSLPADQHNQHSYKRIQIIYMMAGCSNKLGFNKQQGQKVSGSGVYAPAQSWSYRSCNTQRHGFDYLCLIQGIHLYTAPWYHDDSVHVMFNRMFARQSLNHESLEEISHIA